MSEPPASAPAVTPAATTADPTLQRHYGQQIRAWFGELRPLRLEGSGRFFTPPPALPLRAVFVPPALSPTYLQPSEAEPVLTNAGDILQWLGQQQRLVVLGDPGSGKSTLVGWLAWRLCAGLTEPLPDWCEGVVPVPMILRDMQLAGIASFDDLLAAHLRTELISGHPALHSDWGGELQRRMQVQPASLLFLIDGLDELPLTARGPVRDAIREGMARLPQARFMITSRIVGYEQHAIEAEPEPEPEPEQFAGDLTSLPLGPWVRRGAGPDVRRLYVMPFDASRIRQFARNWFEHAESGGRSGEGYLQKFVESLMRDPVARQLARTPNLLVMAAQVFGITNTLPDGRAKLYEAITKAYLESIEQRYGLLDPRYSLEQKKTWLAAVGYQLQLRRGQQAGDPARDLLVAEDEVVAWLSVAMEESGLATDERYVRSFVDAIARRSGLFIPRGEGLYAFSHLSIQEYFAALHLRSAVLDLAVSDPQRLAQQFDELQQLADEPAWREALVTFFELPDWSPRVTARLWQAVFGAELALVPAEAQRTAGWGAPTNAARVELLARLVANTGITLPAPLRQQGYARAMAYARNERAGSDWLDVSGVLGALTANDEGCQWLWSQLRQGCAVLSGSAERLDLRGVQILDFSPLAEFTQLKALNLRGTAILDLSAIAGLTGLKQLWIGGTSVVSLAPLTGLLEIERVYLSLTGISDLSPLRNLHQLVELRLSFTKVTDLDALRGLEDLQALSLAGLPIQDLEPLAELHKLVFLNLQKTRVSDLRPLAGLTNLRHLDLGDGTPVTDTSVLAGLAELTIIDGPDGPKAKPRQP